MSLFSFLGDVVSRVTGGETSGERKKKERDQKRMMNEQIKAYQNQTQITRQELANTKEQEVAEKRRIQEKQIRSLRRTNRSYGF